MVSVVILNFNGAHDTMECLDSLKQITYSNYRVTVVDNASSESDTEMLEKSCGEYVSLLKNTENYGFAKGNNVGIKNALEQGAQYVLLLNNDTVVAPDFLGRLMTVALSDPNIGILGPKSYHFDEPTRLGCAGGNINFWTGSMKHLHAGEIDKGQLDRTTEIGYIAGTCVLISRQVLVKVGLLDERFFFGGWEDVDLCIRARRAGFGIRFVSSSCYWHKGEARSTMAARPVRRKLYAYYWVRNQLILMNKHWSIPQMATSILCHIVRFPHLLMTFLRYYRSRETAAAAVHGLIGYLRDQ